MNILFVSDYYPNQKHPQFCIYIQQQAQALVSLGHRVEVIVPLGIQSRNVELFNRRLKGIPVFYAQYIMLYKNIYSHHIWKRNIRIFQDYFEFKQYDVISIHMFDENTLRIFTEIAKEYQIKLVIHYHGLSILYDKQLPFLTGLLQHRGDRVLRELVSRADAIVGVSNKVCDRVKEYFAKAKISTVYNGVNTELFQPMIRTNQQEYTIISIASLKKIKGNDELIAAVNLLSSKYQDCRIKLIIIGRGPEKENLMKQVQMLGMEHMVSFPGYLPYEEVVRILRQCDVFAMPSYYEALGCAYLEAMACRIPVIGCKHQGIDEIITDGDNGLLVEPHDIEQIFKKLEFLIMNPQRASEIAYNGYQTVVRHYTWMDSARSLVEVYNEICKVESMQRN